MKVITTLIQGLEAVIYKQIEMHIQTQGAMAKWS